MDLLINRRGVLLAVPAGLLSSCGLGANTADVSRTVAFESLVRQIKHDIGTYIYRHQNDKSAVGSGKVCAGAVDFIVSKVAITVTAKVDQTTSGSGGLQVPVNLATLDGSVGVSRVLNDTITTKLSIFPLTAAADAEIEDESSKKQRIINPPFANTIDVTFVGTGEGFG